MPNTAACRRLGGSLTRGSAAVGQGTSLSRPSAHQAFRAAAGQESWRSPLYLALATSSAGGAVALCSSAPARAASTTAANTAVRPPAHGRGLVSCARSRPHQCAWESQNVDIVLYQYQVCPFCNKVRHRRRFAARALAPAHSAALTQVRAFLDYHDIPYRVVEVEPMRKKELQWSEYKKVRTPPPRGRVSLRWGTRPPPAACQRLTSPPPGTKVPVALVNGEQVNDSSDIISHIAQVTGVKHDTPEEQRAEEAQWREWVDSHLVHLLAPNIYRTVSESLQSFDYITSNSNFSTTEKMFIRCVRHAVTAGWSRGGDVWTPALTPCVRSYAGAAIMYAVANLVIKRKYKIGDPREDLYAAADQWVRARTPRLCHPRGLRSPGSLAHPLLDPAGWRAGRPELPGRRQAQHGGPVRLRRRQVPHGHGVRAAAATSGTRLPLVQLTPPPLPRSTGADVLRNTQIEPWYRRMESQVGDTLASPVPPDAVAHP